MHNSTMATPTEGVTLPSLYEMDNFVNCLENGNKYFKVTVKLVPAVSKSLTWKVIEERKSDSGNFFDRSTVYRWLCVPAKNATDLETTTNYIYSILNPRFENISLEPRIENVYRYGQQNTNHLTSEYTNFILLLCFLAYISWVIFSTFYSNWTRVKGSDVRGKIVSNSNGWIEAFSLKKNWQTLTSLKPNSDADRLKCIQTARVFTTFLVMVSHITMFTFQLIITNVELIEQIRQNIISEFLFTGSIFLVQIFFLITSLLVTNQIYEIYAKNGEFTFGDCWCLLINRLFRFWPTLLVVWLVLSRYQFPCVPQVVELVSTLKENCNKYHISMLMFYNNFYIWKETCHSGTWYISADTQLFLGTVVFCYIVLKYRLNMIKMLSISISLSILLFASLKYYFNLPVTNSLTPTAQIRENFWTDASYIIQYTSPVASLTSSLIGILLGYTFYNNKNKKYCFRDVTKLLVAISCLALLVSGVAVATATKYVYLSRLSTAFVGAVVKPMSASGMGLLILAISLEQVPKCLKNLFEFKPFVILGNFTFGLFIWHFVFLYLRGSQTTGLFYLDFAELAIFSIWTYIGTGVLAMFFTLFIEQPGLNIQKKILPQIRKKSYYENEDIHTKNH